MSFEANGFGFGDFFLNVDERILTKNGVEVSLTPKAVDLLIELVKNSGHIRSKDQLMDSVWAGSIVEEGNVPFTINILRKALGDDAKHAAFIETLPRRGYRFIADVTVVEPQASLASKVKASSMARVETPRPVPDLPARSPRRYIFFAVLSLFMLTIAALFWGIASKLVRPAEKHRSVERMTANGQTKVAAISPDGKSLAYVLDKGDSERLWLKDIAAEKDSQLTPSDFDGSIRAIAFSPDGEQVYYISYTGLYKVSRFGGKSVQIVEKVNGTTNLSVSPNGQLIAFLRRSQDGSEVDLIMANADGSGEQTFAVSRLPDYFFSRVSWSPDGSLLAVNNYKVSKGSTIKVFEVESGAILKEFGENWDSVDDILWRPDGKTLLANIVPEDSEYAQLCAIAFQDGAIEKLADDQIDYESLSLNRDGTKLAAVRLEYGANIWMLPQGSVQNPRPVTTGMGRLDGTMSLSWVGGGKLYYSASPNGKGEADSVKADGSEQHQLTKGWFMAGSPDGRYLLLYDEQHGRLGLIRYDLSEGTSFLLTDDDDSNATFSSDGEWVAFSRLHDNYSIWRVPIAGGEPTQITLDPGVNVTPAISMDGRYVAFYRGRKEANGRSGTDIVIVDSHGGHDLKRFNDDPQRIPNVGNCRPQWSSDGSGIYFVRYGGGASNIWKQPIDGSTPTQITQLNSGRIYNFAFSPDEKQIAISYGPYDRDAVLINEP